MVNVLLALVVGVSVVAFLQVLIVLLLASVASRPRVIGTEEVFIDRIVLVRVSGLVLPSGEQAASDVRTTPPPSFRPHGSPTA